MLNMFNMKNWTVDLEKIYIYYKIPSKEEKYMYIIKI